MAGLGGAHETPRQGGRARHTPKPHHPRHARGATLRAYFDSGVITKWYLPEPDSAVALRVRARFEPPSVLTHLHRVELSTAWHLKLFRREVRPEIVMRALGDLDADIDAGVWEPPAYDLADVHDRAESLARRYAAAFGTRTLDILHVAAAAYLGAESFVTGDRRQASLAEAASLRVTRLPGRR